jgi:hypothetical protein
MWYHVVIEVSLLIRLLGYLLQQRGLFLQLSSVARDFAHLQLEFAYHGQHLAKP